jgi:hypothetical protein
VFSCLIRKGINLGPPDLESPQKDASGNTHIFHFSPYPICPKITPSLPYRNVANLSVARFIAMQVVAIVRSHCNKGTRTGGSLPPKCYGEKDIVEGFGHKEFDDTLCNAC